MGETESKLQTTFDALRAVNRNIAILMEKREQQGKLGVDDKESIGGFNYMKSSLCLSLLQLRHDDPSLGIEAIVIGLETDGLHFRSRNGLKILIDNSRPDSKPYTTQTNLYALRAVPGKEKPSGLSLLELIGMPDSFEPERESPERYAVRTINELKEVRKAFRVHPGLEYAEISELPIELTRRILRQRVSGPVPRGELVVDSVTPSWIDLVYMGPEFCRFSVRMLDYQRDTELKLLVNECEMVMGLNL